MNVIEGGFGKKEDQNVVDIHADDNARAVAFIEDALVKAKENKATIAVVILVTADASVVSGWSATETLTRPFTVVGALEALKHEYMQQNIEAR